MTLKSARIASEPSHSAGLFASRSLDGPEIGTLVVVVDRAKNLPNLRTMGKQDPYCAARLGKTAKKTETDRRGGQTPRWDQELRFSVYESLDYTKLKVSVFNEEKRTDLIGETWISLEEVIRRGGGQSDAWHELNAKGKYAGQIRIELTYYDTRPKEERPALTSSQSLASGIPQEHGPQTLGPRELGVKRRPLPPSNGSTPPHIEQQQRANSIPLPQAAPRSYHTPPRQGSVPDLYEQADQRGFAGPGAHYPAQGCHAEVSQDAWAPEQYAEEPQSFDHDASFAYTDDPYAPQAARERDTLYENEPSLQPIAPLRHDRVQRLSNVAPARPVPQGGLPHTHSAPVLSPQAQLPASGHAQITYPDWHDQPHSLQLSMQHAQKPRALGPPRNDSSESPRRGPPPPSHRNSAPTAAHVPTQPPNAQPVSYYQRPTHQPSSPQDMPNYPSARQAPHTTQPQRRSPHVQHYEPVPPRRMSDQNLSGYEHNEQYEQPDGPDFDPRTENGYVHHEQRPSTRGRISSPRGLPSNEPKSTGTQAYGAYGISQAAHVETTTPLYKPQAISPSTTPEHRSSPQIQRKSISPRPPPATPYQNNTSSVPFSPDSFAAFNPSSQHTPAPSSPFDDSREPSPMYPSRQSGNTQPNVRAAAPIARSSPATTAPASSPAASPMPASNPPLRDATGRIVDPSDYLPPLTYAPEPKPKGTDRARASITATIKTRFGPRDARAIIPSKAGAPPSPSPQSSPAPPSPAQNQSPRNRLQKRGGPGSGNGYGNSSPLAPSPPGALNAAYSPQGHYTQQSAPPPVPGKVPLDAQQYPYEKEHDYSHGHEHEQYDQEYDAPNGHGYNSNYDNGNASTLSQEMARIDIGPSPLQRVEMTAGSGYFGTRGTGGRRGR